MFCLGLLLRDDGLGLDLWKRVGCRYSQISRRLAVVVGFGDLDILLSSLFA